LIFQKKYEVSLINVEPKKHIQCTTGFVNQLFDFNKKIAGLAQRYILIWPSVLVYHLPLLFRHLRHLQTGYRYLKPSIFRIDAIFRRIYNSSVFGLNFLKKITDIFKFLADHSEMYSSKEVATKLMSEKSKIVKISSFFSEVLLKNPKEEFEGDCDWVKELAVTFKLLNALVDDLSTRHGFFSEGKKRDSSETLAAQAQAIHVKEDAEYTPRASFDVSEDLFLKEDIEETNTRHIKDPPKKNPRKTKLNIFVKTKGTHLDQEQIESFLAPFLELQSSNQLTFLSLAYAFFHFVIKDILIGIPLFCLVDLPHLIKDTQSNLAQAVSQVSSLGVFLTDFENMACEIEAIHLQVLRLEPVIDGIEELFLSFNASDATSLLRGYERFVNQVYGLVESTDSSHVISAMKEMQGMIFKINPLLMKFLDAIEGRSLAAVITVNPFRRASKPNINPSTTAASGHSSDKSSSSGESEATQGSEKTKGSIEPVIKGFLSKIAKGFTDLAKPPV